MCANTMPRGKDISDGVREAIVAVTVVSCFRIRQPSKITPRSDPTDLTERVKY